MVFLLHQFKLYRERDDDDKRNLRQSEARKRKLFLAISGKFGPPYVSVRYRRMVDDGRST